jgi:hypothetical protein
MASPLNRFPFRLHRLLNLPSSAGADWRAHGHHESDVLLLTLTVLGLPHFREYYAPAADFGRSIRVHLFTLTRESPTCRRSPQISSTALDTRPPDLPPVPLMDRGFAVTCQLAQHRRPHHPVLVHRPVALLHASFRPPPRGDALALRCPSPPSGWDGTFTPSGRTCSAYK